MTAPLPTLTTQHKSRCGNLTWPQFDKCCSRFSSIAAALNDDWVYRRFKNDPGYSFLEKRVVRAADKGLVAIVTAAGCVEDMEDEEAKTQCEDQQCLPNATEQLISCVYHVVYSHSYNVPVLYFNMHHSDGRLLTLEEVWQQVPDEYRNELYFNRWGAITQQEHPLLCQPYFWIHPCQTESIMSQVELKNDEDYILSWLSMFGPLVGLKIPLAYVNYY
ncbi:E2-like conjugating enzyme atg10 [Chamberlinius hualienensis]